MQSLAEEDGSVGHLKRRRAVDVVDAQQDIARRGESARIARAKANQVFAGLIERRRPLELPGLSIQLRSRRQRRQSQECYRVTVDIGGREAELHLLIFSSVLIGEREQHRSLIGLGHFDRESPRARKIAVAGGDRDAGIIAALEYRRRPGENS